MRRQAGFTLIELMITIVVIGILTAVALPSYTSYMLRTRLADAWTGLAAVQPLAEQHWSNGNTFAGFASLPAATDNFTYTLPVATATAYTIAATGRKAAAGFVFTIDQNGRRATPTVPTGWTASTTCWVRDKGGKCSD